jgi:UDP-glucose 4-epimerase
VRSLVTGGAGFIGSHLVDRLMAQGDHVTVVDNLETGTPRNLCGLNSPDLRFINASVLDEDTVDEVVKSADRVFHLAAAVGVRHIVDDPLNSLLSNTRGTDIVLTACFRYWKKVLLASTSEVYGKTSKIPMEENDGRVLGPTTVQRWSYSTAKAVDEHLALAYGAQGLPVVIVRYFNSYGPRLDPRGYGSVIANFFRQAESRKPLPVHGDGRQTRCFTYIDDTIEGTVRAMETPAAEQRVFNIGNPDTEISIGDLAKKICALIGSDSKIVLQDYEDYYGPGFEDTRRRVPSNALATAVLGWTPTISLDVGLRRTYEWWTKRDG